MNITLRTSSDLDKETMRKIKVKVEHIFHCPIVIIQDFNHLSHALNIQRKQYLASELIKSLISNTKVKNEKVIGIVDVDLYSPPLNFVFGEADYFSCTAIMSLCRLRQEYYGLPADEDLLITRAGKEIIHELGHTMGLQHCSNPKCVMHFSNGLADTDWKEPYFCEKCRPEFGI